MHCVSMSTQLATWVRWGSLVVILATSSAALPTAAVAGEAVANWAPAGNWRGEWISSANGHRGPLRASIRQTPAGDYRAVFAGRFAKIIPFAYSTRLTPTPWPGHYTSVKRLPLVGTYRMSATVTAGQFEATFQGRKDQGVFRLKRR